MRKISDATEERCQGILDGLLEEMLEIVDSDEELNDDFVQLTARLTAIGLVSGIQVDPHQLIPKLLKLIAWNRSGKVPVVVPRDRFAEALKLRRSGGA